VIGQRVGPYAVIERLGGGGMGEVYLAEDTRLGRRVALKRPSEAFLSAPDARDRLHREASAAGRLTHPNIAAVYDVLDVDAYPYIVMEYVEGETLSTVLARGPLTVERTLEIGLQIADALVAAHARGVVHRDLKPGNICLTADGIAKVLDFGIAKGPPAAQAGTDTGPLRTITAAGQAMGTPGYSSPEQMVGAAADPRDDVYGVGILLYELLTGRRPFEGVDALELAVATMTKTAALAHQVNPSVPAEVSLVLARAIARDRDERYPSAQDLRDELRRVSRDLATSVTGAVSTSTVAADRRTWRRRTWSIVLLVIASWALPLGLWWRASRVPQPSRAIPVVAILPFANNSKQAGDAPLAAAMRDVLIANLGGVPGLNVLSKSATGGDSLERGDPRKLAKNIGATYLVDGSLQRSGTDLMVSVHLVQGDSGVVVWSGSYAGPEKDIFSLQERLAQGVSGAHPIGTSGTAPRRDPNSGTRDVDALSKYGQAVGFLERPDIPGNLQRATSLLRSAIERDPNFALAWARLGEALWAIYQETSEPKWASEATSATSKALTLDQQQPEVWISLGMIHHGTGRREEAITDLDRALTLQPNSDDAHRLMGQVLQALGRNEEAEKHYREAVALRPNYWRHYNLLGGFYYATGRTSDAVASFTRVTELQPDSARGFHNLGAVYYALGDNPNALKFYERALAIEPRAETFSNIGNIHYIEGRYSAAAASFQKAVDASPQDGLLRGNLGDALARLNRKEQARLAYAESVRLDRQALAVNPNDATTLARVATREAKLGERTAAEADITRALTLNANDAEVLYHAAVVRALNRDVDRALASLEQALRNGYSAALAARDHDLDAIRQTPRFRELVASRE
jgi:serine/threonine-protein kinase